MRAVALLEYRDKPYAVTTDFGPDATKDGILYMWQEGNYACDCNRSLFIHRQCDKKFPEMECGQEIEMLYLTLRDK